jgi:nucleoside-diphosphate-sugar epimerase
MYGDNIDVIRMENQTLHESYFNETSTMDHNPYQFSKVLAEKEAWRISRAQNHWDLVVICPGFVVGPTLSPTSKSGSLFTMDQLLCGRMLVGVPDLAFALVDVRDVASAHIRAAEVKSARGRYIVSTSEMTPFVEISKFLKSVHTKSWSLPGWQIPNWILRLFGPLMGLSRRWIDANLGIRFLVDNTRSINELGIEYREITQTLVDHYHSWAVNQGG